MSYITANVNRTVVRNSIAYRSAVIK